MPSLGWCLRWLPSACHARAISSLPSWGNLLWSWLMSSLKQTWFPVNNQAWEEVATELGWDWQCKIKCTKAKTGCVYSSWLLSPLPFLSFTNFVSIGTILSLSLCAAPCCSQPVPWRCHLCLCLYAIWAKSPPELVSLWVLLLGKPRQRPTLPLGLRACHWCCFPSCCWRWHCKPVLSLLVRVRPTKLSLIWKTWLCRKMTVRLSTWSYLPDSGVTPNHVFPPGNRVPHHNVCDSVDLHPCQPGSSDYSVFLHRPSEPRTPSWWGFFSCIIKPA